jgi:hypothetical protein
VCFPRASLFPPLAIARQGLLFWFMSRFPSTFVPDFVGFHVCNHIGQTIPDGMPSKFCVWNPFAMKAILLKFRP